MAVRLRPAEAGDVEAGQRLAEGAFRDLGERNRWPPEPPPTDDDRAAGRRRILHLIETDPGGAFVTTGDDGEVSGLALALVREGVWGLSLLVVDPAAQSRGTGRALLDAALGYAEGTRGQIILSSDDHRAIRRYSLAGFTMLPANSATGPVDQVGLPRSSAREGGPGDAALIADVDRHVRGAARNPDLPRLLEHGRLAIVDGDAGRGYGIIHDTKGGVRLLAATTGAAAADVLARLLSWVPDGAKATVGWLTADQAWAWPVVNAARLAPELWGPVFVRGDVGPMAPYLPSGAYL